MDDLVGRTAVVTGGGSGIGRAIVLELGGAGMNVVVADIEEAAAGRSRRRPSRGARALAVHADVTDFASVQALADAAYAEFGAVHVLCNNAGVLMFGKMPDLTIDDWGWVHGVNVWGVLHGIYAFLPRMLEHGEPGHIVNTASIAALSGHGVYGVVEVGVLEITETLREDLDDTPIGVSCLFPGMVSTAIVTAQRNRPASFGPTPTSRHGLPGLRLRVRSRLRAAAGCGKRSSPTSSSVRGDPGGQRGPAEGRPGPVKAATLVDAIDAGIVDEEHGSREPVARLSDAPRSGCVRGGGADGVVAGLDEAGASAGRRRVPASSGSSRSRRRCAPRGRRTRPSHPAPECPNARSAAEGRERRTRSRSRGRWW